MLQGKVVGLEGMQDAIGFLNNDYGNAFSSARVLGGFRMEENLSEIETYQARKTNVSGSVVGLEGMLNAIDGIPTNGRSYGFSITKQLAGLLRVEDLPEIVTLEVA